MRDKIYLRRYEKLSDEIIKKFEKYEKISDEYILKKSLDLKNSYDGNVDKFIEENLVRAYALCMSAIKRCYGITLHKVQLMAGIGLCYGFLVEQKTGEGKSLTGLLPAYLYGLTDKNCHVVTVNPYLTKRDGEDNGKILSLLGLSTGIITDDMKNEEKKENYAKDVVYVSNTELGFDYLRDQIVLNKDNLVLRGFDFCIVDEVDSILIDEAKTPLIISSSSDIDAKSLFTMSNMAVYKLNKGYESERFSLAKDAAGEIRFEVGDYYVREKERQVILTDIGIKHLEEILNIENIADSKHERLLHAINQSLYAKEILKKDRDYMVRDGEVLIIDEFTGRVMDGRTFSNGLHQAIEAKEKVNINPINDVAASITYQNFFRKYDRLSGMSGTLKSEEKEFLETYNKKVLVVPTNKPIKRVDRADKLYLRRDDKYRAVIDEVKINHEKGRPILLATASLSESEYVSDLLDKEGFRHKTLNAKQDKNEADIIKKAGDIGAITVATNMAGRGTDIKLSPEALDLGGLLVIGTEKHESERIDNQLRGRSGRQGDPGESVFYLSTEDRVLRTYGSDILTKRLKGTAFDDGREIDNKSIKKAIKKSQDRVSLDNFTARQDTLYYDDVDNVLREWLLSIRREILLKDEDFETIYKDALKKMLKKDASYEGSFAQFMSKYFYSKGYLDVESANDDFYKMVKKNVEKDTVKKIILLSIDKCIKDLLKSLDYLRHSVRYVGYGGVDSRVFYNKKAYEIFKDICNDLNRRLVLSYFKTFYGGFYE